MASVVMHFLLVFDHSKAKLICEREFGTDADALFRAVSIRPTPKQ